MEKTCAVFVVAVAVYLLVYFKLFSPIPFNWFRTEEHDELKLLEYDKSAYDKLSFKVFSSEKRVCNLHTCEFSKSVQLSKGENYLEVDACELGYVELKCSDSSIHFTFNYTPEEKIPNRVELKALELNVQNGEVIAVVDGNYSSNRSRYKLVNFFVDGNLVRSVQHLFEAGSHDLKMEESFLLYPGRHSIAVSLDGVRLEGEVEVLPDIPVNEYLVLILSFFLSVYLARKNRLSLLNSFLLFFTLTAFLLAVQFQLGRNLGYTYLVYPIIALTAVALLKERTRFPRVDEKEALRFAFLATLACVVVGTLLGTAILTSHYYLRQTDLTYMHGSTNYFDELSYLGRSFTYPSQAFFMLTSTFAKLLSTVPSVIMPNFHNFLIFLFTLTLYLTTIKLKSNERVFVSLVIFSNYFVLTLLLSSPLHTLAFLMLGLSVYFYVTGNRMLSILSLSVATATHLTMLIAFPLFAYASSGFKIRLKEMLVCLVAASSLASVFYLPFLSKHGLLYQIVPQEKGFLQSYGLFGSLVDFNFVFPLILMTILFGIFNKRYRIPTLVFFLAFLFYLLFSYRMNVLSLFMLPFLFVSVFRKANLKLLMLLPIASVFMVFLFYSGFTQRCEYGAVNKNCIQPMQFIATYTSSKDSVVTNPIFGHLEAYYGQRKVLADVFVEYADVEKYEAAKLFSQTLDTSILRKYDISIAVLESTKELDKKNDKIYDNSLFSVYRLE